MGKRADLPALPSVERISQLRANRPAKGSHKRYWYHEPFTVDASLRPM
jgi:hypothetical protein